MMSKLNWLKYNNIAPVSFAIINAPVIMIIHLIAAVYRYRKKYLDQNGSGKCIDPLCERAWLAISKHYYGEANFMTPQITVLSLMLSNCSTQVHGDLWVVSSHHHGNRFSFPHYCHGLRIYKPISTYEYMMATKYVRSFLQILYLWVCSIYDKKKFKKI